MPWTAEDMAKKGAKRPEVAARTANGILKACLVAGGSPKVCEPKAIRLGLWQSNKGGK